MLSKETFYNENQAMIHLMNANQTHCLWPRAEGKTSGGSGRRTIHVSEIMPRSQCIIYTDTFKRTEEILIPNITTFLTDSIGVVENEDFVVFKKPPEEWVKPWIVPRKFDRVMSFKTGFCLCMGAANVDGSVNGFNAQSAIVEETKYVNRLRIKSQLIKALRGGLNLFGHLPEYRSVWSFTDKFEGDIDWILKLRSKQDPALINAVLSEALYIEVLKSKLLVTEEESCDWKMLFKEITNREARLNATRKELVFVSDAKPFANVAILGEKFYRDAKRDSDSAYEFNVAILNKDPDSVQNTYYPALSKKRHYYTEQNDINPDEAFICALDWQWRIIPMPIAQYGCLPGRMVETLNFVDSVHTLHPNGGIIKTINAFCKRYEKHREKVVYFVFDQTAIAKPAEGQSNKDIAVQAWIDNDWTVIEVYIGKATLHHTRHEDIKNLMGDDIIMFNEVRAKPLLTSVKNAGAKRVMGKIAKDKSGEKVLTNDPVKQTDYSEAMDMIIVGTLILKKIDFNNSVFVGDISVR